MQSTFLLSAPVPPSMLCSDSTTWLRGLKLLLLGLEKATVREWLAQNGSRRQQVNGEGENATGSQCLRAVCVQVEERIATEQTPAGEE
jgi:hypothetical protein